MSNRLRGIVIVVVTFVWSVSMLAPMFIKDYQPAAEMHVAFMAIIGVLTASYKMNNNDKDGPPTGPATP